MPGSIPKALHKFQHPPPKKPQYAPHTWIPPVYGQKVQHALPPETLPVLDKKEQNEFSPSQAHSNITQEL